MVLVAIHILKKNFNKNEFKSNDNKLFNFVNLKKLKFY
jgi:hypothetical protein